MKLTLTTSEMFDMRELANKPSKINSIKHLSKYIKAYSNLELIQAILFKELGIEYIDKLNTKVTKLLKLSPIKRNEVMQSNLIVISEDIYLSSRQKFVSFYILHEINKIENKYGLD